MQECLCPNCSEMLLLCSKMLGPHMAYCTYRSILTVKRTKKEHGSSKDELEEQRGTGAALCLEQVQYRASQVQKERGKKSCSLPSGEGVRSS